MAVALHHPGTSFGTMQEEIMKRFWLMPIAALVLAMRQVILDDRAPSDVLMYKALLVSCVSLVIGTLLFRRLKRGFYDYL